MHLGFSYIGLIFLIMLMIPNLYWTKNQPKDYEKYVHNENKILLLFERAGEVLVTCLLLIFSDFNIQGITAWMIWLIAAFVLMIMYELYWIRYFKSEKTMKDFYSSIMGIPVAGATLPVIACCLIAIYGRNPMFYDYEAQRVFRVVASKPVRNILTTISRSSSLFFMRSDTSL